MSLILILLQLTHLLRRFLFQRFFLSFASFLPLLLSLHLFFAFLPFLLSPRQQLLAVIFKRDDSSSDLFEVDQSGTLDGVREQTTYLLPLLDQLRDTLDAFQNSNSQLFFITHGCEASKKSSTVPTAAIHAAHVNAWFGRGTAIRADVFALLALLHMNTVGVCHSLQKKTMKSIHKTTIFLQHFEYCFHCEAWQ